MALSKKQREALQKAKKDGITKSEAKDLKELGIPKRLARATERGEDKQNKEEPKAWDPNTGLVNSKYVTNLSSKQQFDLAARGQLFNGTPGSGNSGPVPTSNGGNQVVEQAAPAGPVIPEYGGRGSGEFNDIIASLQADEAAGLAAAEELRNKGVREVRGTYKDDLRYIKDVGTQGLGLGDLAIAPRSKDSISREALELPTFSKGNNNRGGSSGQSAVARPRSFASSTTYAPGVSLARNTNPVGPLTTNYAAGVSAPSEKVTSSKGNRSAKTNAFDNSTAYAPGVSAPGVKGKGNGTIDPFANSLTATRAPGVIAPNPNREPKATKTGIAASGFNPADYGSKGLGLQDYEALKQQGYSNNEIRSYAKGLKGVDIGSKLQAKLGLDGGIAQNFNPADYGAKGLGLQDYDELKARGYNDNQIKSYAEGLQGVKIGGKLQEKLAGIGGGADGADGGGGPEAPTLADILNEQQFRTDTKISGLADEYTKELEGLSLQIEELGSINDNWAAANAFMKDQMLSANAARDLAEKRASNLRNAFVPNANPTALSVLYGDNRKGGRRQQDNQLSDLSILSGLGTNSNPLAGLQLA
jgi:hypothetical protein